MVAVSHQDYYETWNEHLELVTVDFWRKQKLFLCTIVNDQSRNSLISWKVAIVTQKW